jgi:DNA polymerase
MYHPAAALHQPSLKTAVEEDFKKLPDLLARHDQMISEEAEVEPPPDQPRQLSLF